jgi:hypothetical protein
VVVAGGAGGNGTRGGAGGAVGGVSHRSIFDQISDGRVEISEVRMVIAGGAGGTGSVLEGGAGGNVVVRDRLQGLTAGIQGDSVLAGLDVSGGAGGSGATRGGAGGSISHVTVVNSALEEGGSVSTTMLKGAILLGGAGGAGAAGDGGRGGNISELRFSSSLVSTGIFAGAGGAGGGLPSARGGAGNVHLTPHSTPNAQ